MIDPNDTQAEDIWSLEGDPEETEFVLEDDETFGMGELEGGEPPPFEDLPDLAPEIEAAAPLDAPAAPLSFPIAGQDYTTDQPLPRITIHAYCDRPDIARLIEETARDRRLSKAQVKVEMGGIETAVVHLAQQASPNLIILDTVAHAQGMLASLDRLAELVEEGAKVVIIGAVNDIALFRELMRRGVSEYIVPPLQPLQLIRTISSLYANPEKPYLGRLISVIGARGGVGASTLAHNIAWSISERQEAGAALVDLDLAFGTAALDFNQDPPQSIADALAEPERADEVFLDRIVTRQTPRLQLYSAPARLEREYELGAEAFETVIDRIRRSGPFIVLDLPHMWTGWIKQTLLASDDAVIIASPDLASLRNAKNIIDLMKAARPYDAAPRVVLNMAGVPKRPEVPQKDFSEALGIDVTACIPFDPALFGVAANNGQMIGETAAASKIAIAIDELAANLTGRKPVEQKRAPIAARIPFLKR